jgi:hypothetical protein
MLETLFTFLRDEFPQATVLVLQGSNVFDDYVLIAYADVVICSVSTFSLLPALSRTRTTYIPRSRVVALASTVDYSPIVFFQCSIIHLNMTLLFGGNWSLALEPFKDSAAPPHRNLRSVFQ